MSDSKIFSMISYTYLLKVYNSESEKGETLGDGEVITALFNAHRCVY